MIYADTSFLFSLYATDENSPRADRLYELDRRRPLLLTPCQRFEFRNTVRRAKRPVPFDVGNVFKQLDHDLKTGVLRHADTKWPETIRLAEQISAAHTETNGQGGVDTVHIAAAILLRVDLFWTFDEDQAATALDFGRFKHVRP